MFPQSSEQFFLDLLELELKVVVNWELGLELESSGRLAKCS